MTSYTLAPDEKIDKLTSVPFLLIHLLALGALFFPVKLSYVLTCVALYYVRMWGITAGYHRYFSHRAYKTNRAFQFVIAVVGCTAAQKGPLWWAAHHRHHHRYSDLPEDIHSPKRGFFWSHVGWILCPKYNETRLESIKDFARFPELRWLNKHYLVPPTILGVTVWLIGGWPLLFWGFFLSTVLLWHGTFTINSLSHVFGSRRYQTTDTSRNNWLLALLTCGEGWHNNHHYYQNTANQGWFWWEVDASYYVLKALSWVGLVSDLRVPSERVKYAFKKVPSTASKVAEEALARVHDAGEKVREAIESAAEALPQPVEPALEP